MLCFIGSAPACSTLKILAKNADKRRKKHFNTKMKIGTVSQHVAVIVSSSDPHQPPPSPPLCLGLTLMEPMFLIQIEYP